MQRNPSMEWSVRDVRHFIPELPRTVTNAALIRLYEQGKIYRVERGLYALGQSPEAEH